jgi:hypothetical protein
MNRNILTHPPLISDEILRSSQDETKGANISIKLQKQFFPELTANH